MDRPNPADRWTNLATRTRARIDEAQNDAVIETRAWRHVAC
jgi:hypothetical protein